MRILYLSGYTHPSHHRKVELLADAPDVEILNVNGLNCGRTPGRYPSANGRRSYTMRVLPTAAIGRSDVHRTVYWPPRFGIRQFRPHLIYCEHEQESLMAAEAALVRGVCAPGTPLILYSWQNLVRPRGLPVAAVCAFTLAAAQHVFCASSEGIEVLRRQGYRGGASVIQQMGLDTRLFYPKTTDALRTQLGLKGFVVGFIGRLAPEKGIDTLLHAAARMQSPIQVLIVGSGPERAALQTLAGQLGIVERCRFVEAVPQEDLVDYMVALDLLVLPSRTAVNWKEQFGRVLVEAMACRVAVAGSASGAIPEVIGDAGRIFPEGDASALAAILDELANAPDLRHALAEAGYRRALESYTIERLAERTLNAWRQLAGDVR
jgi:glycosyltransferase involved in cell wall biosynthesis